MSVVDVLYLFLPVLGFMFGYWLGWNNGEVEGYWFGKEVGAYEERSNQLPNITIVPPENPQD